MTPERWQRVSQLVDAALACPDGQRASFLKDACGSDSSLRQEVLSLLAMQGDAAAFLERPMAVAAHAAARDRPKSRDGLRRSRPTWWIHLGAASFVGYFALVVFSVYYRPLGMGMAVEMEQPDRLLVLGVAPDSDSGRAGVRVHDLVVAVNGHHLRTLRDYRAFIASARVDDPQTYVFDRSGRQFAVPITPRQIPRSSRLPFVPVHIGLFISLVLSLVVLYSRPSDPVARLGAVALASVACSAAPNWPVGLAGTWLHLPVPLGALLWPACLSSVAVGPIMFALFALFPRVAIRRRWVWLASLTPGAVVTVWAAAYLMLVVYRPERSADVLAEWFTAVAPLSLPAYFAGGIAILVSNYLQSADLNERRRIRVLLLGMSSAGVGLFFGAVAIVLEERGSRSMLPIPPNLFVSLLLIALPCAFAYAIIAQRLFDIRILVRLGLRYALARQSILVLVPALLAGIVVDLLLHGDRPLVDILWQRGWAYLTLLGVAAAAYRYRTDWLASIDRRFFRERYDAQQIFTQIIQDVRTVGRLDAVAARTVSRMSVAFHSSFVALLVREPHRYDFHAISVTPQTHTVPHWTKDSTVVGLVRVIGKPVDFADASNWLVDHLSDDDFVALRADDIEFVAPVVASAAADRREAMLVFGAKRSEEPYSREDRELVAAVADSLAMLVQPSSGEVDAEQALTECPQCGLCDSTRAARCAEDGSPLVHVALPRVLGGRYTIQRRLGRGGMGAVYEARDAALERMVAVKVIRDEMLASADAADRFRREALIAASFTHPNVVTVHDFGITDHGRGYLVMELLSGATLREALRQGPWPASRTLQVMRGVCLAVDEAHRRQLVHRDLKPENIFLVRDDVPKVLDFGIAKSVAAPGATSLTATNNVIGTLDYMSPEQRRGGVAAPPWDVWALAVIAYEMINGGIPSLEGLPPAIRLSGLSGPRHAVFARAFAVDATERPSGALALLDDLHHALDE